MDKNLLKLAGVLDKADAELLIAGSYRSPHLIKLATNKELLAVDGIGRAVLKRIRKKLPRLD